MTAQPAYIANMQFYGPLIKVLSETVERSVDKMRMEGVARKFAENNTGMGGITQLPRQEYYRDAVIIMPVNYKMVEEGFREEASNVVKFQPKKVFAQNSRDAGKPSNDGMNKLRHTGKMVKFESKVTPEEARDNVRYLESYRQSA